MDKISLLIFTDKIIGSGALSIKMLLVRIVENYIIYDYLGQVRLSKGQLCPIGLGKGTAGLELPAVARNNKKNSLKLFSIIPDPASNQKVHLIPK